MIALLISWSALCQAPAPKPEPEQFLQVLRAQYDKV